MRVESETSNTPSSPRLLAKSVKDMTDTELEEKIAQLQGIRSAGSGGRRKRAAEKVSSLSTLKKATGLAKLKKG